MVSAPTEMGGTGRTAKVSAVTGCYASDKLCETWVAERHHLRNQEAWLRFMRKIVDILKPHFPGSRHTEEVSSGQVRIFWIGAVAEGTWFD